MKIKWIVTGLVALVVAVVVAGVAILSTMEFEELRGVIEAEAEKATGRELEIAGPIDVRVSWTPAIAVQDVRFANAPWGSRAAMVSVRRFELEVALLPLLSGDIQVKRLVVVEPDILLETDDKGRGNWEMAAPTEAAEAAEDKAEAAVALPSFDTALVRDAVLTYRDGRTGEELRLRLDRLEGRAASPATPLEIAVEGAYNDAPFKVEGTLGAFEQLLGGGPFPIELTARAGGATIAVEGRIAEPMTGRGLDLKVQARGRSLADLGALSGAALPPLGPYDLGARVAQDGQTYALTSLTAKIGSSDLAGNATLALGGARPALRGSFTAAALSLGDFAPAGEGTSEEPLPLAALMAVDAEIKLSVKRLALRGDLTLSDLDLSLVLDGGKLALKPFSVGVSGGKVSGELSLNAAKKVPPLTVELSAKGIDYGRLLKDRQITDGVSGRLDAQVRLRGAGASARAIAAGLGGRIEVIGGQGSVRHDLVQAAGAGLTQMLSGWSGGDSDLRLNCIVVRLPVEGGVASGEAILLDTAAATVGGTGTIDLRDETLDLRVTPQAKQTSLMSLAVPFLIGGTLASPAVAPDPVGTAVGAAKIAGLFINPLTAGAAIVLESEGADQNPCVAALERPAQSTSQPAQEKSTVEEAAEGAKDVLEGVGEGISKGLKSLFGN
jgi:uncharacterized protein involved in outer membrane biogenesis